MSNFYNPPQNWLARPLEPIDETFFAHGSPNFESQFEASPFAIAAEQWPTGHDAGKKRKLGTAAAAEELNVPGIASSPFDFNLIGMQSDASELQSVRSSGSNSSQVSSTPPSHDRESPEISRLNIKIHGPEVNSYSESSFSSSKSSSHLPLSVATLLPPASSSSNSLLVSPSSASATFPPAWLVRGQSHSLPKTCAYCALTGCQACIEGARKSPPQSCHMPEHGRSVCASCAGVHRFVVVDSARTLVLPLKLSTAFYAAFNSMIAVEKEHKKSPRISAQIVGSTATFDSVTVEEPECTRFSSFYSHLNGHARCFDVYDALDTTLWKSPLAFEQIFVFPTTSAANRMRALYVQFLEPLPGDNNFERNASVLNLRLWHALNFIAQCSAYQASYPLDRDPLSDDVQADNIFPRGSVTSKRLSALIPNFYSASLCRKNNASHLKKQRGSRAPLVGDDEPPSPAPPPQPRSASIPASSGLHSVPPLRPRSNSMSDQPRSAKLAQFPSLPTATAISTDSHNFNFSPALPILKFDLNEFSANPNFMSQIAATNVPSASVFPFSSPSTPSASAALMASTASFLVDTPYTSSNMPIRSVSSSSPPALSNPSFATEFDVNGVASVPMFGLIDLEHNASHTESASSSSSGNLFSTAFKSQAGAFTSSSTANMNLSLAPSFASDMSMHLTLPHLDFQVASISSPVQNKLSSTSARKPSPLSITLEPSVIFARDGQGPPSEITASLMSGKSKQQRTFRKRMAFQLLASHRFKSFRCYLHSFPIDKDKDPANFALFELQRFSSYIFEMLDLVYFSFDSQDSENKSQSLRRESLSSTSSESSDENKKQEVEFRATSKSGQIAFGTLSQLFEGMRSFEPLIGNLFTPLSLSQPSVYIAFRFLRFWSDVMKSNAEFLAGVPASALHYQSPADCSLLDLQREGASLLDELFVLKQLELEDSQALMALNRPASPSALLKLLLHVEVMILWLLGTISARVREARRRYIVLLRFFSNQQSTADGVVALSSSSDSEADMIASLPPLENIDPVGIYERAVKLAVSHSDGMYDINTLVGLEQNLPNVPKFSMLASAYPVFFSQAMETIGAELTQEMKHPAYAFTGFQLAMKKSMWEQHFGAAINSPSGLPVYPSDSDDSLEDSEEYLSWTVLFPHEVESSPSFLPCTFFNLQFAAHFVPPLYSTVDASPNSTPSISPAPLSLGSSESSASFHASSHLSSSASASQAAASQRLMRVASMLSSVTGKSFAELPRTNVTILQSLEPAAPSVQALFATHGQSDSDLQYTLPNRQARSMKGMRLLLLALGYAQKIEDACSSSTLVLQLAHFFIYFIPRYALAMKMLMQLDSELEELVQHMPSNIGPDFERSFIVRCQQQCKLVLRQFRQHCQAKLRTPFFVGQTISLKFACGMLNGIMCSVDVAAPYLYMCEHPQFGLIWALAMRSSDVNALCADSSRWRSLDSDRGYDSAMGATFYGYCHRLLLHELRLGRYSCAQFLADLRAREQQCVLDA